MNYLSQIKLAALDIDQRERIQALYQKLMATGLPGGDNDFNSWVAYGGAVRDAIAGLPTGDDVDVLMLPRSYHHFIAHCGKSGHHESDPSLYQRFDNIYSERSPP